MLVLRDEEVLVELDQIDRAICASESLLEALKLKRTTISDHLNSITMSRPGVATPHGQHVRGVTYRGEFVRCRYVLELYVVVLDRLWKEFPEYRDAMAAAMASGGYNRKYVAKTREGLFDGHKLVSWVRKYSAALVEGWFVDTNISSRDLIARLLQRATKVVGLKWGRDVQVTWFNS
jgi:hypothetical protein